MIKSSTHLLYKSSAARMLFTIILTQYANLVGGIFSETYTVREAIEHIGLGKFQYFISPLTAMLWLPATTELAMVMVIGPTVVSANRMVTMVTHDLTHGPYITIII